MLDLLADAIASGDGPSGSGSDADIRSRFSSVDVYDFEQAAAAVACACASFDAEKLPHDLRLRCSGAVRAVARETAAPASRPAQAQRPEPLRFVNHDASPRAQRGRGVAMGWLAAAACLAIAASAWWPRGEPGGGSPATLSGEQRMATLVGTAEDLTRWDWNAWDEAYGDVKGEVVWSEAAQEGYLLLTGMPVNDPSAEQYQLWVIESSRGTPLEVPPVDGGVFNVTESGRIVIPVRCAIRARGVVAFAITREQPGGVVVSDRSRKTVIAQAPALTSGQG